MANKTHKDRVNDFNTKLEALSEHHDIPKVRITRVGANFSFADSHPSGRTWITPLRTRSCLFLCVLYVKYVSMNILSRCILYVTFRWTYV